MKQHHHKQLTNDSPPPAWKVALLTWMTIYPTITVLLTFGETYLIGLPLALRTLVLTGILVPLMCFVLMPKVTTLFGHWLRPTIKQTSP